MAARSLMSLFRELNPAFLLKKDRGRTAQMNLSALGNQTLSYGEEKVHTDFLGAELLQGTLYIKIITLINLYIYIYIYI